MRLAIDIDGVICEYPFHLLVKEYFRVDLDPASIFAYDLADVLGVAPSEIDTMFKEQVYGKPNFVEGAIDTLTGWKQKGYTLVIFSNRTKYMGYEGLARWLIGWGIPFSGVGEGNGNYDVHIDDSPGKLMATDSKLRLLFNQSWNERCLNITGELVRVYNWADVREKVNEFRKDIKILKTRADK